MESSSAASSALALMTMFAASERTIRMARKNDKNFFILKSLLEIIHQSKR
jgi:hypothetical protein